MGPFAGEGIVVDGRGQGGASEGPAGGPREADRATYAWMPAGFRPDGGTPSGGGEAEILGERDGGDQRVILRAAGRALPASPRGHTLTSGGERLGLEYYAVTCGARPADRCHPYARKATMEV